MPFDREIHLGYVGPDKVFDFIDRMKFRLVNNNDVVINLSKDDFRKTEDQFYINDADISVLQPKLRKAYMNTIRAFGWDYGKIVGAKRADAARYIGVISPWGNREAVVWGINVYYDPYEVSDTTEEITLGVDLSGRYFPTMLDMKDPHGTMGSVITIDNDLLNNVKICKDELVKEIPELYDAELYIKEIFY